VSVPPEHVQEFAALLTRLKERTDRSYGQLARRLHMNTSTLHRYCAGETVPVDFAPVERFAALCHATAEERMELHRLWILAVAARQRTRTPASTPPEEPVQSDQSDQSDESTEANEASRANEAGEAGESDRAAQSARPVAPRRPWYRRRRVVATAAVASALLATLGSLSALPTGGPSGNRAADGPTPFRTATAPAGTGHRPATASPSPSPSTDRPAKKPSVTPTEKSGGPSQGAEPKQPTTGVPLTWTADSQVWELGCSHDYVIARPPREVPPPPAPQDARTWAGTQGAVHGRKTLVEISVQGRTSTAVVLKALRVRVVGRTTPAKGNVYAMDQGCGGQITPRSLAVDLDVDRPIARPVDGDNMGTPIPAVRLPYRVSAEDPEVLLVAAETATCDCRWYLELDWSSQGRAGTVRIDDHGRPFRTSAVKGMPRYTYATWNRAWEPLTE
jgi:hypothetical protein